MHIIIQNTGVSFNPGGGKKPITVKSALVATLVLVLLLAPQNARSRPNAEELMRQVYEQGRIQKSQRIDMEILIKDAKGRKRVRFFKILYKITSGQTRSLLRFYKPSDIKGTGLFNIVYDREEKQSDQWVYFPAFRTVNKLSVEEKHQSFMGSDFTNADIAGRKPAEDRHKVIKSDEKISVVSSVPKDRSAPYSKIESIIINRIKVPERIVFYDRSGNKLKTLTSKRISKIGGMYVIIEAEMKNHLTGGSTFMKKKSINFKKIKPNEVVIARLQNR